MKKLGLVFLLAGALFANTLKNRTNDELMAMIATADAKTMSEISFELDKRAGVLMEQARKIKGDFKDKMRDKISKLSDDEREKFMGDFRQNYEKKLENLSVKDAKNFGFFGKKDRQKNGNCKNLDKMPKKS
ncbi:DUF1104 domain-containing protein [Campylobacter gastrosuis]|uniref:DUF1104 domain-containing protein n=1 Tax=Campylobacter gastrosuis TaxID=2974576 RepID=A0ABT7HRN3_9BACT|nr:DUF1104 domain-containing protein [Campylobacter gastrosuis]MDL0089518.1 DUF1104 domain-containing protein [Campylobacter gastrosuis]